MNKSFGALINYWELGMTKVIGRFQSAASLVIVSATLLAVYGIKFSLFEFIFAIVCLALLAVILGVFYAKFGLFNREINKYSELNPFYSEMLERTRRIEQRLTQGQDWYNRGPK